MKPLDNAPTFSPAFGNRPVPFIGREQEINDFVDGLRQRPGNRKRSILLLGQRGMGKTVLLWEFAERAQREGFIVAKPTTAGSDLPRRIIEKLQDAGEEYLKGTKAKLEGGSVGALGFSVGLQFSREEEPRSFQSKLGKLTKRLNAAGKGVLVLVDEVRGGDPEIRQVVTAYQELIGEGADVALVMAGLPSAVSETLNDSVLTFLNRAYRVNLGPLRIPEIAEHFRRTFNLLEIDFPEESVQQAARATEGSPYFMQLIGHYLVAFAAGVSVDDEVLQRALACAEADFKTDICKTSLKQLSDVDVAFLAAMSEDTGASKMADVAARLDVSADYAQKYRRRLLDAGIISAPRRGYVEFAVPLLAEYLREE